ncbi:MAG: ABC transporter ATP-binding protein [Arenicella sp.]|nr:ABC transporter ATP-binding protein [Arenicella sp.]
MTATPLLTLDRVSKRYASPQQAVLSDVQLSVDAGELIAITGPSGSGKSTLLYIMCGLEDASSGDIVFDGITNPCRRDWVHLRARRIGLVFQAFNLLAQLTALENIELPMLGIINDSAERKEKAEHLLEQVGLSNRATHLPQEMSGGEQQRVAIARSLANSPDILLCDEPTGNLDSKSAAQVLDLLNERYNRQGMSLVIVTHNSEIASTCDRSLRIVDGKLS